MDDQSLDAFELLADAAHEIDAQIHDLAGLDADLQSDIGEAQVDLLKDIHNRRFDLREEEEVRLTLGYHERKLLWVWARLGKLKQLRCDIARNTMKQINKDNHE